MSAGRLLRHLHPSARTRSVRRRAAGLLIALALALSTVVPAAGAAAADTPTIAVDGTSSGRTFDGVGALSAGASSRLLIDYPEPERSQLLDYLFKPGYGAALQVLKVEIGGDTNSTDGTEPSHMHTATDLNCNRGYEWWLMEQAKARDPNIKLSALAWGAPGWVGAGQQTVWTDQFTQYLLAWLGCAQQHGLHIDSLGGWNEKGFNAAWYENLHAALASHGYGYIQIVADDSFSWTVVNALTSDPAFAQSVDVVGQHYVCGYLGQYTSCPSPQAAQDLDKPLWASEQGSQPYNTGAAPLARAINRQYTDGRITGTVNWSLEWSAYQGLPFPGDGLLLANEPWSGHYVIGPSAWVVAQTTQFTRPGWRYLDSGSTRIPGGSVVSLRAPDTGDWTSVAETLDATAAQQVDFTVSGGLSTGPVHVWATNLNSGKPADWFVRQADIQPNNGRFAASLQPGYVYSFTTTNGQGKGAAAPPSPSAWALPYHDNFDSYPADATPRYISDLGGTFATAPCRGGRTGMCLRSVVSAQPVLWNGLDNYPLTIVGDPANWHDYQVGVDAMLEQSGAVDLGGRVINGVSGYHLIVRSTGQWTLTKVNPSGTATTLASGTASFPVGTWHRLTLKMRALEVTAAIDGTVLATVSDQTYDTGQVSLAGSAWQNAEFDNLVVTPSPGVASKLTLHDVSPSPVSLALPGDSTYVSAQVTNPGPLPATNLSLTAAGPAGWTITPVTSGGGSLAAGDTATWRWRVTAPPDAAPGRYSGTLTLHYTSGGQNGELTQDLPILLGVISHAGMTASADSSQEPNYDARYAIDDDPTTMWHTQWDPYQPLPHEITLNLGADYDVSGLIYLPRQDNNHNGVITSYTVSLSLDGTHFTPAGNGSWADDFTTKSAQFPVQRAHYIRLTALAGHNGFASAAEINVLATPSS
jgi:O-glycosyl hydrolase